MKQDAVRNGGRRLLQLAASYSDGGTRMYSWESELISVLLCQKIDPIEATDVAQR